MYLPLKACGSGKPKIGGHSNFSFCIGRGALAHGKLDHHGGDKPTLITSIDWWMTITRSRSAVVWDLKPYAATVDASVAGMRASAKATPK